MSNYVSQSYLIPGNELRELLVKHPDLPLLVFAEQSIITGEYEWQRVGEVRAKVGECLDCKHPFDEYIYTERQEFERTVREYMIEFEGGWGSAEKQVFDAEVKRLIKEFEPYWKPCIIVLLDN